MMSVNRVSPRTSVIDVLDHVVGKGIVIDQRVRVSFARIDLLSDEAQVIIDFTTRFNRRLEDRVREERHDSRATTFTHGKARRHA